MSFREQFERLDTEELLGYLRLDLAEEAKRPLLQILSARGVSSATIEGILASEFERLQEHHALQERRLASVGARLAAFAIDLGAAALASGILEAHLESRFEGEQLPYAGVLFCGYMLLRDAIPGQGLGKRLLGLRAVRMPGERRMTLPSSFIRNVTLLLFLPDALSIAGESRRRLGDRLARTIVLRAAAIDAGTRPAASPPAQ
ncbi:RDD family protein [Duganella sp. Root1480D1]|uniref:RDD family protein n=1 Tax=Duganella sp. Root1480D1 TaxID=1736471 RepID=UPI00070C6DC7|nr:RDD family protein [Duganella sp. Root1480D1]KQZ42638.1 hypothetical protein ASD58_25130 [Duganella sp. Root1480D1]